MKVETKRFGVLEVEEGQIIHVPSGIIGFPQDRRFILLEHQAGSPFLWLQSLEHGELAFVVVDPLLFQPDYQVRIGPEDRAALQLDNGSGTSWQALALVTITPAQNNRPLQMTANLLGPIVIHFEKRLGRQVVLGNFAYSHRHPIPLSKAGWKKKTNAGRAESMHMAGIQVEIGR